MKRSIALAALVAAALLVTASPAGAQSKTQSKAKAQSGAQAGSPSEKVTVRTAPAVPAPPAARPPLETVRVDYSWRVPGLPGMVPNIGQGNELVEGGPRLKLDQGPPVPLSHLDFGGYEPYIPQLAREALREAARARLQNPLADNGIDDVALTVTGTPNRTVASAIYSTPAAGGQVTARAGVIVPSLQNIGDRAVQKNFLRAKDLKVDVKYKF